jgi:hypothetical protein
MLRVAIFRPRKRTILAQHESLNELSNRESIFLLCGNKGGNHPIQVCNRLAEAFFTNGI